MNDAAIVLHATDNVATVLVDLKAGDVASAGEQTCKAVEAIPFGHKIALRKIARGEPVVKYGEPIGLAAEDIAAGCCVHVHNVESQRGRGDRGDKQ